MSAPRWKCATCFSTRRRGENSSKARPTEFGHISEGLVRLALPYPQVAFKLTHHGRVVTDLPATSAEERLLCGWPGDFREQRLPIDVRDAEIRIRGLLGLPELAHPTARHQYLYLNGRHIRDKFMQHALREAFRGLTEPGRFPAAILLLEIPPQDVDVNVHPTKIEVRFRDSGRIHGLVMAAVREKLLGSDLTPSAVPMHIDDAPRLEMRHRLAEFFRQMPPEIASPGPLKASPQLPLPAANAIAPAAMTSPKPAAPLAGALQLHNTYLVAQSEDGLIIIDQHALHERIMYEELLARLTRGPLESQRLLIPQVTAASKRQLALLEKISPLLQKLGIEAVAFGPNSVAVQAFPSFLEKLDPAGFVRDLLERGEQELLDMHGEELLHEILDMMACKAAVKAGDALTPAEIDALLARRELVERSSNCPHGRPTTLRLSLRDLEKQFKRTGF